MPRRNGRARARREWMRRAAEFGDDLGTIELAGARTRERPPVRRAAWLIAIFLAAMLGLSFWLLSKNGEPGSLLSPPVIALLLVANLIPAIALMVCCRARWPWRAPNGAGSAVVGCTPAWLGCFRWSRRSRRCWSRFSPRCCSRAASNSGSPTGRGDVREYGRRSPRAIYNQEVERVAAETVTMSKDVAGYLRQMPIDDPRFAEAFARIQVSSARPVRSDHLHARPERRRSGPMAGEPLRSPARKGHYQGKAGGAEDAAGLPINSADRVGALTRLDFGPNAYFYAARVFDPRSGSRSTGAMTCSTTIARC